MKIDRFVLGTLAAFLLFVLAACERKQAEGAAVNTPGAQQELQATQAALAALPAQCTLGDAAGAATWIHSVHAAGVPGAPFTYEFTFNGPVRTRAFHVALNAKALQNLEKVETRDARGTWTMAWSATQAVAPAGCAFVKLAQGFTAGALEVTALRISVRPDQGKTVVADASVLQPE